MQQPAGLVVLAEHRGWDSRTVVNGIGWFCLVRHDCVQQKWVRSANIQVGQVECAELQQKMQLAARCLVRKYEGAHVNT
jgi:hypothetical protein